MGTWPKPLTPEIEVAQLSHERLRETFCSRLPGTIPGPTVRLLDVSMATKIFCFGCGSECVYRSRTAVSLETSMGPGLFYQNH